MGSVEQGLDGRWEADSEGARLREKERVAPMSGTYAVSSGGVWQFWVSHLLPGSIQHVAVVVARMLRK